MENLREIVFSATVEPEKFKFYKLIKGPDDSLRYLMIHAPNSTITKKVFFIIEEGVVKYENLQVVTYVFFESWERCVKETDEAGFQQIYLKQFAAELFTIGQMIGQEIN